MVKIITDAKFYPNLSKSIHYISWTPYNPMSVTDYSKMAWVDAIVSRIFSDTAALEFYRMVDYSNETGTLYPKANITIMPSYRQPYSDEEIYHHFDDAMKAQNMYIHAKNIIFDMRNYTYINPYTDKSDNEEYFKMISHAELLNSCISKAEERANFFVIIQKKEVERMKGIQFEYATEEELAELNNTEFNS